MWKTIWKPVFMTMFKILRIFFLNSYIISHKIPHSFIFFCFKHSRIIRMFLNTYPGLLVHNVTKVQSKLLITYFFSQR